MRSSLLVKLMGAFLLVIVIGALVIYALTTQATQNAFRLYTTQNGQLWAQRLAPSFADFYARANSWEAVDAFIQASFSDDAMPGMMGGMGNMGGNRGQGRGQGQGQQNGVGSGGWQGSGGWMGGMGQRLILADAQGRVIGDTENTFVGSQLSAEELAIGAPIIVQGALAGTLIIAPAEVQTVANPANTFISSVNRSILISVLVAGAISLLLVSLFFVQITAPIRQMQKAAGAISKGDLSQRVAVRSKDELGSLAETFNQMASDLESLQTQRRKLFADIAHELRTPVAVIQANTEGMQDGVLPMDTEQINTIHTETIMLSRLINDLRLISLAEAGELRLERQPANIARLLDLAIERFQPQCQQKGVTLTGDIAADLPELEVDADRVSQIMNNLIGNALRYTPTGGEIAIQAARAPGQKKGAVISVSDTGSGIAPEDMPWVFDRFYRADPSRARASGGTGLGLAIVRKLVEAHGGSVSAASPIFQGTPAAPGARITFTLFEE